MSCITEILKKKGDQDYLMVPDIDRIAVEGGGTYKGFEYLITFNDMGFRCGYVALPPTMKLPEGKTYEFEGIYDAHGGMTFAGKHDLVKSVLGHTCEDNWLGFDCGHAGDGNDVDLAIKLFPNGCAKTLKDLQRYYSSELDEVRTKDYVEKECMRIIDSIITEEASNEV